MQLCPSFSFSVCSCSAGGVPPVPRVESHEQDPMGPLQVSCSSSHPECGRIALLAAHPVLGGTDNLQVLFCAEPESTSLYSHPLLVLPLSSHRHLSVLSTPYFLFPLGLHVPSPSGSPVCYSISEIPILFVFIPFFLCI